MAKGGKLVMDRAVIAGDPRLNEIVYCYTFPSRRDRIKIGYSSRGLRRIVEQSTGFPENPEVLFVIHHKDAVRIEPALHKALEQRQAKVLGNEWFQAGMRDVLAVSPLLRQATRRQRWKSIPRLFAGGAMFGVGMSFMPIIGILAAWAFGKSGDIAILRLFADYLKSPFVSNLSTVEIGKLMMEFVWYNFEGWVARGLIIASPIAWIGLAYVSFRRQVV